MFVFLFSIPSARSEGWFDHVRRASATIASVPWGELIRNAASPPSLLDDAPQLDAAALEAPLLGARLSELAYAETAEEIRDGLATLGDDLELVHFHAQTTDPFPDAQWFAARRASSDSEPSCLFVVFRGTRSIQDMLYDLQAIPSGVFHAGFLSIVRRCTSLHRLLEQEPRSRHVCLLGHSLGGALALTLVGAGYVPQRAPFVSVTTFGAPAAFYGTPPALKVGRSNPQPLTRALVTSQTSL